MQRSSPPQPAKSCTGRRPIVSESEPKTGARIPLASDISDSVTPRETAIKATSPPHIRR